MARLFLDTVDSTNAEGLRRAATLTAPLWIVARRQTAGRGRRMRPWTGPEGNFYGSLVLHLPDPPAARALRSFVAALALRDALAACGVDKARIALKWPNDVLIDGAKLSGILLEGAGDVLTIGIGVNLIAAPPADVLEPGALPAQSVLAATGLRLTPGQLLDRLEPAFDHYETRLRRDGFAPVRAAFLAGVAHLGAVICARTGTREQTGVFEGIDAHGNLLLRPPAGGETVAIPAAEVFFNPGGGPCC